MRVSTKEDALGGAVRYLMLLTTPWVSSSTHLLGSVAFPTTPIGPKIHVYVHSEPNTLLHRALQHVRRLGKRNDAVDCDPVEKTYVVQLAVTGGTKEQQLVVSLV